MRVDCAERMTVDGIAYLIPTPLHSRHRRLLPRRPASSLWPAARTAIALLGNPGMWP
jgi:hypothetical protein